MQTAMLLGRLFCRSWYNWRSTLGNYVTCLDQLVADGVDLAATAGDVTHVGENWGAEQRARRSTLYATLASLAEKRTQAPAHAVPNRNGYGPWRQLVKRFSAFNPGRIWLRAARS